MTDDMNVNWFRVCIAINGFRAKYGYWPAAIRLPKGALEYLFKPASLEKVNSKIKLIYDDSFYIAVDEKGNQYNFKMEGFLDGTDIDARDWLGIEPDLYSEDANPIFKQTEVITESPVIPVQEPQKKAKEKNVKPEKPQNPKKQTKVKEPRIKKVKEKPPKVKRVKTRKGKSHPIVVILISELLLLLFSSLYILLAFSMNFQGQCIRLGTITPCSMPEYLYQVTFLIPGRLMIMATTYWYVALPLILLFPLIGLALNTRKGKRQKAAEEQRLEQL